MKPHLPRALIRFGGCPLETRAQRWGVVIARIVVALAGGLFLLIGVMVINSGVQDDSLLLASGGALIAMASLALIWAGFTSNGRDVCAAAVLLFLSFLTR